MYAQSSCGSLQITAYVGGLAGLDGSKRDLSLPKVEVRVSNVSYSKSRLRRDSALSSVTSTSSNELSWNLLLASSRCWILLSSGYQTLTQF